MLTFGGFLHACAFTLRNLWGHDGIRHVEERAAVGAKHMREAGHNGERCLAHGADGIKKLFRMSQQKLHLFLLSF